MKTIAAAALAVAMLDPTAAAEPDIQITRAGSRSVSQAPATTLSTLSVRRASPSNRRSA